MNNYNFKKMVKNIGFLLCFSLIATVACAQRGWEVGGWVGTSHYFGDLNTSFDISRPGLAVGGVARYNYNERLCLKFSAGYGSVSADDANSSNAFEKRRNLSFRSKIIDATAQFEFNFLPYRHGSSDEFFTPYLFGGLSVYNFNPETKYNGKWVELRPLGTEGQFRGEEYYSTLLALAYGGGFKIDLTPVWSLNVEVSARKLFSDYLDDVSGSYPNSADLQKLRGKVAVELSDRSLLDAEGKKLGQTGRQRGNSQNKDTYVFTSIGLVYYFGSLDCPTW